MALLKHTAKQMTNLEAEKVKTILNDPVKWAQIFVTIFDSNLKRMKPWVARWYQAEMMQDTSIKKVYRCGRRTGKTETMIIESLHRAHTKKYHRILIITPYENQVRLIFMRINEILNESPLLKACVVRNTKNPYCIELDNGSAILGFTTGAGSGSGGASIRGQRADTIVMDECDYMQDADFDAVMAIAGEREDISIIISSTPTGRRGKFYLACTEEDMHFHEHYHPSMHNPGWSIKMEAEFKAMLSEQGYVHEILAEFGTQATGVFDKNKIDAACNVCYYAYHELDYYQEQRANAHFEECGEKVQLLLYDENNKPVMQPFRTVGVDWDKYNASSSILILEYDFEYKKFKVLNRIEVPRAEYSYDAAINLIIKVNEIYNPAWIYCDAGSGEYQLERLHIYGDEHPETGLKNKVIRRNFKQNIEMMDPVTHEIDKKPLKQLMVNQLQIAFERDKLILSPFDEVLYKQLIDYEVVRHSALDHTPIFTNKNEHFVDALGLAYLAFVLEFPNLTNVIEEVKTETVFEQVHKDIITKSVDKLYRRLDKQELLHNKYTDPFQDEPNSKILIPKPLTEFHAMTSNDNWGSRHTHSRCQRRRW